MVKAYLNWGSAVDLYPRDDAGIEFVERVLHTISRYEELEFQRAIQRALSMIGHHTQIHRQRRRMPAVCDGRI